VAQLIVHNLEDEVILQLKLRAAQHGRSTEAEHRAILLAVLGLAEAKSHTDFKAALLTMPDVGTDKDFQREPDMGRDLELFA